MKYTLNIKWYKKNAMFCKIGEEDNLNCWRQGHLSFCIS